MTLDSCYQQNKGKSLLVPGGGAGNEGQCVQWADTVLHDVYGRPYHYANAIDWFKSPGELLKTFDRKTDGSIKKGDFVIFNEKVGSVYGHIDVAMGDGTYDKFTGADSNWAGNKTVHLVNHVGKQYILGVLRRKSTVTPQQKADLALGEKAREDQYQPRLEALKTATLNAVKAFKVDPDFRAKVKKIVG